MSKAFFAALGFLVACGPSTSADDSGGESTQAGSSSTGTPSTSSTGADESSETTAVAESTSDSSSTGEPFTYSSDEAHWELPCGQVGAQAWIEIYPNVFDGECLPSPDVGDDYAFIVLEPWDGQGGTFVIDDESTSKAAFGTELEAPVGEVTLEVSAPWTLVAATIDLSTSKSTMQGTVDLSQCGATEPADPCE
jgi:hypothetical protein